MESFFTIKTESQTEITRARSNQINNNLIDLFFKDQSLMQKF